MEAIELLSKYKKKLEPFLKDYFQRKMKSAGKISPLAKQAIKMAADFTLAGGKRLRPAMVYYGYLACGGKENNKIIEASMGIELIHTFLLIHDDVIDRDETRHGISTVHEKYRKIGEKISPQKDNVHFGNSVAIIIGDMAATMANEIIFNSKFSSETIVRALDKLQDIVYVTIPGELMDIVMENRGHSSEKEVLDMFEGKTSRYTFEGPLHLGAVLAGSDQKTLKAFSDYSLPLGKAFQIRDDILGIFGNEKELGKPVGSDVIEGKQTILLVKAMDFGTKDQKNALKKYSGKKTLSNEELKEYRKIIKETGSLEYCEKLAKKLVEESLAAIHKINFKNEEAKIFLTGIAQYIISREK